MIFLCRQFVGLGTAALCILLVIHGAWSQTMRTMKIVVPASPGAVADILARLLFRNSVTVFFKKVGAREFLEITRVS